jgi:hypothetical protein
VVTVGVVIALIVALTSGGGSGNGGTTYSPAETAGVLRKVTSVPSSVFDEVGAGTSSNVPKAIDDAALTSNGKPVIAYVGAEYCPYCAAERWAMVLALSRFGTFTSIPLTHSSANDVFPNTPTFTFRGAKYESPYLTFTPTETASNQLVNGNYQKLDTPPANISELATQHAAGSIPFVYFGGSSFLSGATYDPGVLAGKTHDEIASALSDPSSDITQAIVGSANVLTASICKATNNQPADVCNSAAIKQLAPQ